MTAKNTQVEDKENTEGLSRSALRRMREREHRYQTILKAAETLFAREGYHKASMERLADMAEVSVGAVYFYFKNKEDLLIRLLDEIGYLLRSILAKNFKEHGSNMAGFEQASIAFFEDFCMEYPEKVAIIYRESVGQSPEVEKQRKKLFDKTTRDVQSALLQACENQGKCFKSRFAAEVITVSILGIFERVAYRYIFWHKESENLKSIGRDAIDFILGGIEKLLSEDIRN